MSLGESYRDSSEAFADDSSLDLPPPEQLTPPVSGRNLLERKWMSIIRLQRKVGVELNGLHYFFERVVFELALICTLQYIVPVR